jgi:hypothetical protein
MTFRSTMMHRIPGDGILHSYICENCRSPTHTFRYQVHSNWPVAEHVMWTSLAHCSALIKHNIITVSIVKTICKVMHTILMWLTPGVLGFWTLFMIWYSKRTVQWMRLVLSNIPNRTCVSHPSPEDGYRSSFENVMFFRISDNGLCTKSQ